ncbi:MAG: TetR/AcrR family transcriptional regulator C-terminal ligand-binding domain-containing protein [Actinomycetota bacterium]
MNDTRSIGRPPGPHDDTLSKLLPSALRLFLDEGGAALTPTRLHHESGVSRATIYRNWPEPADLIEVMLQFATAAPETELQPMGDMRADLQIAMEHLLFRFEHRPARAFFGACLEYGRQSERVSDAAESFVAGILDPFRIALAAAVEAGEVDGPVDDLLYELTGPPILRHVILGQTLTAPEGAAMVDRFVDAHTR